MRGDVRIKIWTQGPGRRWTCVVADDDGVEALHGGCPEPWSIDGPSRRAVEEFAERLRAELRRGVRPVSFDGSMGFFFQPD